MEYALTPSPTSPNPHASLSTKVFKCFASKRFRKVGDLNDGKDVLCKFHVQVFFVYIVKDVFGMLYIIYYLKLRIPQLCSIELIESLVICTSWVLVSDGHHSAFIIGFLHSVDQSDLQTMMIGPCDLAG